MRGFSRTEAIIAALVLIFLQGCIQQDTTGDTAKQEVDRQNAYADAIASQYSQMKGDYVGTYNGSNVFLHLDVRRRTSTGNGDLSLVPQPTMYGNMSFTPSIFADDRFGQPLVIPYAVTDGQYASGNDLSLTVQENNSPTTVHCGVSNLNDLDCSWSTSSGQQANFQLERVSNDNQSSSSSQTKLDGVYQGKTPDGTSIRLEFETLEDLQPSGTTAVPQVSIVGSFVLDGNVDLSFKGIEYDPVTQVLVMNINGTFPIVVNCKITGSDSLHCVWHGSHGLKSNQAFDLSMSK